MDWSSLPVEALEQIFRHLRFKDRLLACSLVCQHWNRTLFSSPTLARGIVLGICGEQSAEVRDALKASQRNYRRLSVMLRESGEELRNDGTVNEFLAEVAELWNVQSVTMVAEPALLLQCFRLNGTLFDGITELSLELTKNVDWVPFERQDVVMRELKKLHYLQMYLGRVRANTAFRLVVPKLEFAAVVLDSLANEEALYWEDPLIELEESSKLRSLELDLNTTMWESFFDEQKPHLERLLIRRASDEYEERDWDRIFKNMPNLRSVEMVFSSDVMLASLRRNCKKLDKLVLNAFCYQDGTFANNMNWSTMKYLFMDGLLNGGVYSRDHSLTLSSLEDLQWKYVELTPSQGYFTLITPNLINLTLRGCDYKRFHLEVGPYLQTVDIDYYGPQQFAPNFFSHLHNVTQLTIHINGSSLRLCQLLTYRTQLRSLEMICGTEHRGYDINDLFSAFLNSCPLLTHLTVRNEHENLLLLDYPAFTLLSNLKHLNKLNFQYITLLNVTGSITGLNHLDHLDVSGCRVQDPHGVLLKRFPIDGNVEVTEGMEWTVSSTL